MKDKQFNQLLACAGRLRDIRNRLNFNQKEFAARLEMSASYLSEVETGKAKPSFNFLIKLAEVFGVSADFLLHGSGGMLLGKNNPDVIHLDFGENNTEVRELLDYFKASPLVRYTVMAYTSKFLLTNSEIIKIDIDKSNGKAHG